MIYHDGALSMVIKRTASSVQDFVCLPFENIVFLNNNKRISIDKFTYEIIQIDTTKQYERCTPEELLKVALTIYRNRNLIHPIEQYPITPWEHYVKLLEWTDLKKHYPEEAFERVCNSYYKKLDYVFRHKLIDECTIGWVHGDMHVPNVLKHEGKFYVIDFDTSRLSYAAINVAQAYYTENFKKYLLGKDDWRVGKIKQQYRDIVQTLSGADAANFNNFIQLMGFYWEARTIPFRIKAVDQRMRELNQWLASIARAIKLLFS